MAAAFNMLAVVYPHVGVPLLAAYSMTVAAKNYHKEYKDFKKREIEKGGSPTFKSFMKKNVSQPMSVLFTSTIAFDATLKALDKSTMLGSMGGAVGLSPLATKLIVSGGIAAVAIGQRICMGIKNKESIKSIAKNATKTIGKTVIGTGLSFITGRAVYNQMIDGGFVGDALHYVMGDASSHIDNHSNVDPSVSLIEGKESKKNEKQSKFKLVSLSKEDNSQSNLPSVNDIVRAAKLNNSK